LGYSSTPRAGVLFLNLNLLFLVADRLGAGAGTVNLHFYFFKIFFWNPVRGTSRPKGPGYFVFLMFKPVIKSEALSMLCQAGKPRVR
jgi:hypothetical protein